QRDVITMRGIGTSLFNNFLQPTVSTYANEIPLAGYFFPTGNLDIMPFDLERVEFLKGPQGTLYGSASLGGVVRYLFNRPNLDRNEGALSLSISDTASGGTGFVAQGMFNVVLAEDKFALRGVVAHEDAAGWIDHETLGKDHNTYDQTSGRLMASWTPSDKVRVDATYIFQDSNLDAWDNSVSSPDFDNPFASQDHHLTQDVKYRYKVANGSVFWDLGFAEFMSSTSYLEKGMGWNLEDGTALANAMIGWEEEFLLAIGVLAEPGDLTDYLDRTYVSTPDASETSWFQEFRLVSNDTGRFDWIAGLYYADAEMSWLETQPWPGLEDRVNEVSPGMGTALYGDDSWLFWEPTSNATELAVYGELGIDLSSRWKLNVGGRYTDLEKTDDSDVRVYDSYYSLDEPPVDLKVFSPKVSLAYNGDASMWYALVSRGYRAGGVNSTYVVNNPDATEFRTYDTDNLWNYETGIRKAWAGGKVTTDVTLFYLDWTDIQLDAAFLDERVGYVNAVFNAAEAFSMGVEAVLSAQLTDSLSFNTAIMWNQAELAADTPPLWDSTIYDFVVVPEGTALPTTPEWSAASTLQYCWMNGSMGYPWVSLQHFYKDSYLTDLVTQHSASSQSLFNLQLGASVTKQLQLTLAVRNLLDERKATDYTPGYYGLVPESWWLTRPRTMSLTAQWNF
ncbi:MAG: TonB-dependent receptor, partial [Acidobacteriota bacterium]